MKIVVPKQRRSKTSWSSQTNSPSKLDINVLLGRRVSDVSKNRFKFIKRTDTSNSYNKPRISSSGTRISRFKVDKTKKKSLKRIINPKSVYKYVRKSSSSTLLSTKTKSLNRILIAKLESNSLYSENLHLINDLFLFLFEVIF